MIMIRLFVMILMVLLSGCASNKFDEAYYCDVQTKDRAGNYGCSSLTFGPSGMQSASKAAHLIPSPYMR
jgi:hypothetical protein